MTESFPERIDSTDVAANRREILQEKGAYEGDPAVSEIVSLVRSNMRLLSSIIDHHLSRSGVEHVSTISSWQIVQFDEEGWKRLRGPDSSAAMSCEHDAQMVLINDASMVEKAGSELFRPLVMHDLVHEFCHAMQTRDLEIVHRASGPYLHERGGVRQIFSPAVPVGEELTNDTRKKLLLFEFLDEAINDELAEEVNREFAVAAGILQSSEIDAFYKDWNAGHLYYNSTRRLLSAIVRSMSRKTGVAESAIRESFKRAAIEGADLTTIQEFDSEFGPDFILELGLITDQSGLDAFIKKYDLE